MLLVAAAAPSVISTSAVIVGVAIAPFVFQRFLLNRSKWLRPDVAIGSATTRYHAAPWVYLPLILLLLLAGLVMRLVVRNSPAGVGLFVGCALTSVGMLGAAAFAFIRIRRSYVQIEPDCIEFKWGGRCHRIQYQDVRSWCLRDWYLRLRTDAKRDVQIPLVYRSMPSIIACIRDRVRMGP